MRIGFTGTRSGTTKEQKAIVSEILSGLFESGSEFHHGCCDGSDDECAAIARKIGYRLIGHPPLNTSLRGSIVNDFDHPPLKYLDRNLMIVMDTAFLIATPYEDHEVIRSGTWSTIRRAVRHQRYGLVIWPNGDLASLSDTLATAPAQAAWPS